MSQRSSCERIGHIGEDVSRIVIPMWDGTSEEYMATKNVHSIAVDSDIINRSKFRGSTDGKLKKIELKRSHSRSDSVSLIRNRKSLFKRSASLKGMYVNGISTLIMNTFNVQNNSFTLFLD